MKPRLSAGRLTRRIATACILEVLAVLPLHATDARGCLARAIPVVQRSWSAPLDRAVTLREREASLREVLDRVAAAANIRLAYSSETLPLDRRTCAVFTQRPVGDVLADLLSGTNTDIVAMGGDQVVLAPRGRSGSAVDIPVKPVAVLDRIVVTGSAAGVAERTLPYSLDAIRGRTLTQQNFTTMASALDAFVPGMWMWSTSPAGILSRFANIRGASSFGVSYPKIYIDGIEVANPLLVTQFAPEAIERIEVIRGPQGAALYGADAISGVINVVTKHEGAIESGDRVIVRSEAGSMETKFASGPALSQMHSLTLRAGSSLRSADVVLGYRGVGEFLPDQFTQSLSLDAGGRIVGSRLLLTGLARVVTQHTAAPINPVLIDSVPVFATPQNSVVWFGRDAFDAHSHSARPAVRFYNDSAAAQSALHFTVGGTAKFVQNERWTHTFVVGVDGYELRGVPNADLAIPLSATGGVAANGGADRGTLRISSVGQFGAPSGVATTLTLGLEHSQLREHNSEIVEVEPTTRALTIASSGTVYEPVEQDVARWRSTTGAIAQARVALHDRLFVTGGLRMEDNDAFGGATTFTTLPMVGAAYVFELDGLSAKVRSAYGKGIRPAQTPVREVGWGQLRGRGGIRSLDPEEQKGFEAGADITIGNDFQLRATRFVQRATGLIQQVCVPGDEYALARAQRIGYALQNVGAIDNSGWELQASVALSPSLSLNAGLALTDSRVAAVATGYTGDLRVGDRMLGVPARVANVNAVYGAYGWIASATLTRAASWLNYDRLGLARALASSDQPERALVGAGLRSYWREYDGITHLRATLSRDFAHGFSLTFTAENLLNRQIGEPDNISVLPGRTLSIGASARF